MLYEVITIEELCENLEYDYCIKAFLNGETFIENIRNSDGYDIIFLDIQMGMINGIEVGKTIRNVFHNEKAIV